MKKRIDFMNKFGLIEKKGIGLFSGKLKNYKAQMSEKRCREVGTNNYFYTIADEIRHIEKQDKDKYCGTYNAYDHHYNFYSRKYKCYILTVQPYWFHEYEERIKNTYAAMGLSIKVLKNYTWWNDKIDCTLFAVGTKENLDKIFKDSQCK